MFGLFKTLTFSDPVLGELRRKGGAWRGEISLGEDTAPLTLPGTRSAPDPQALVIARSIPTDYSGWRKVIEASLFEHYGPYAEAVAAGQFEESDVVLPHLTQPDQVWPYTSVEFVAVTKYDAEAGVEIGYRVVWDEEHTLSARLRNGRVIELNGSVLPP